MKKILILCGILIILIALLFVILAVTGVSRPDRIDNTNSTPTQTTSTIHDATYMIDGEPFTLNNGISSVDAAPGSASKIVTHYFGNEVIHDFNGDGRPDRAFLITQNTGGSGTFYYVVVELDTPQGNKGSEAYLLGDRIAPQTTELSPTNNNIIVVNYADRNPGDSFAVAPSVGKTVQLLLDPQTMKFGIVANNFEGESNSGTMTLVQQKWNWVTVTYNDGTVITPRLPNKFSLTFTTDGRFTASTDCNAVGGDYVVTGTSIVFTKMISTMMACQGSQEGDFTKALNTISSFHFTSKGELVFDLKMDSGVMVFK